VIEGSIPTPPQDFAINRALKIRGRGGIPASAEGMFGVVQNANVNAVVADRIAKAAIGPLPEPIKVTSLAPSVILTSIVVLAVNIGVVLNRSQGEAAPWRLGIR